MASGGLDRPRARGENGRMMKAAMNAAALRYRTIHAAADRAQQEGDVEAMFVANQALGIASMYLWKEASHEAAR